MSAHNDQRERMIADQLQRRGITDPRVLQAFADVPREEFVDEDQARWAYEDGPLSIGFGQTISQPYIVALTAEALELQGHERVLEIGAGSGYAAAILGKLANEVHTIDRIPELCELASSRLARLGYDNVLVHCGDGTLGLADYAPFEAIAVAAGAPSPPPSLLQQLTIGGRIVLPHGNASAQRLVRITRHSEKEFREEDLGDVRFVPLIGAEGWSAERPH
ncbi:MAG TPA: protein-L-isoaspartate(D-aspartate) O-methyltransferase [Kofleriaceae bacterium]|jgi:protein-L-isoaspartate(D-aspartate) O-methyltransferase|nr:protein-L-isoaspartate(D-aspartate) O-methyltransferase [Kofleriaceae bacterium]